MAAIEINNPIVEGYYADPEARFYEGKYWIYVTYSKPFKEQQNLAAFSSVDMKTWEKHDDIIDMSGFPWAWGAVWAPTILEKKGKYYLIFATNDIHSDEEPGGLEIAVSDSPAGPFKAMFDHSLVEDIYNGAQPIDAHLFEDSDGTVYLYYGGWKHCIVMIMNETMDGFLPFPDGEYRKEITPKDYVEGPCMIKRGDKYIFMWSSGNWFKNDYCVYYGTAKSPIGPFEKEGVVVTTQEGVAKSPGHNGYFYLPEEDEYYLVYHRKAAEETNGHGRVLCIDKMQVSDDGIEQVSMT